MTTTELLSHTNTPQQADAVLRVAARAEMDLGVATRVVAFSWEPLRGYVTLQSGRYTSVVLTDGTIADETPT